jgi:RimJ/RimL family protein N-acetyltransferase
MCIAMDFCRTLLTARLSLTPVGGADLGDLRALKADPRVFAVMLGGVRSWAETADELAEDVRFWGAHGYGIWAVRERPGGGFLGIAGLKDRPDGRGVALRFALWPEAQGRGLAREAAFAALRHGHEQARLARIIAVARTSNVASRTLLGGIGMTECDRFTQRGFAMVVYESQRAMPPDETGQDTTRQAQTGQARTRQAQTGQAQTRQAQTGPDMTGPARTAPAEERPISRSG